MNLAKKLKNSKPDTLYMRTAKKFNTSYIYVTQIASGIRNPTKKKGLEIKQYLESEIAKMEQTNPANNL